MTENKHDAMKDAEDHENDECCDGINYFMDEDEKDEIVKLEKK